MEKTKILSDYEALERNEFWKVYIQKLNEYFDGRSTALDSADADSFMKIQGQKDAMKVVLGKPKQIIDEITKEA